MAHMPHIVLVDDDSDFLEINRCILEGEGYRVSCFTGADEAIGGMDAGAPDLVITDLMMGRLDSGFSFAGRIRKHDRLKAVPIVIVSGISHDPGYNFHPRDSGELAAMNADAFLEKPVAPELLIATVKKLLQRLNR